MLALAPPPDPLRALSIEVSKRRHGFPLALGAAVALHALVALSLPHGNESTSNERPSFQMIDLPPPVPTSPPKDPPPPEPAPEPARTPATAPSPQGRTSTPAAPAQAARVVTRPDTSDEPVDLTDSIVTGDAANYAGGTTSTKGTSRRAVRGSTSMAAAQGQDQRGRGRQASLSSDRSRRARLVGRLEWSCPFPSEADLAGVNLAVVGLTLRIGRAGNLQSVSVISDPGHGFGAAARRCAYSKRWQPALDPAGEPVSSSLTLNVRFTR